MQPTALRSGSVFATDYRIAHPLSAGGMGSIYVVEQISTGKHRALKIMHPQLVAKPDLRRRFEQEARIGAQIESEHIVEVHAAGVDQNSGLPFLVMELLTGQDLDQYVTAKGALRAGEAHRIFEQLCHGLGAAHAAGIVHRDLKPENVFIATPKRAGGAAEGDPTESALVHVKLLDFGIAKLIAEAGAKSTAAMGSPIWMAPEQTRRSAILPAADVWALGLIAFYVLTGRSFWRSASEDASMAELMREIVLDPIPTASDRARELGRAFAIPAGFDEWLARCLDRDASKRPPNAREAWRLLDPVLKLDAVPIPDVTLPPDTAPAPVDPIAPTVAMKPIAKASPAPSATEADSPPSTLRDEAIGAKQIVDAGSERLASHDTIPLVPGPNPDVPTAPPPPIAEEPGGLVDTSSRDPRTARRREASPDAPRESPPVSAKVKGSIVTAVSVLVMGLGAFLLIGPWSPKPGANVLPPPHPPSLASPPPPLASDDLPGPPPHPSMAPPPVAYDETKPLEPPRSPTPLRPVTSPPHHLSDPPHARRLTTEDIQRVINRARPRIEACYETARRKDPTLKGTVTTSFVIEPDGTVRGPVVSGSMPNRAVGACVAQIISTLTFPRSEEPTSTNVPFAFSPPGE